jgi:hypothetical protein
MYVMEFVNRVRRAQGCEPLDRMPAPGADGSTPLELSMGCRLEAELMRLSSPQAAAAVAEETGLPVGVDRMTVALPSALSQHARGVAAVRGGANRLSSIG